jgi:hypothetical protein
MIQNIYKNISAKIIFNFLVILFLTHCIAFAQEGITIRDVDILEKQKTVLMEKYPHIFTEVEIKGVQKINSRHSKVFYEIGDQQYEAVVNSGSTEMLLVATSKVLNDKEMPNIVMDAFKSSEYKSWNIENTFEVTTPYSSLFYRIDVLDNNKAQELKKIKSLFYTHLGRYKKPPY